jgi:two-component system sensor histidine kinase KdpD
MSNDRPDPDELLARVAAEEARAKRGKLRIYFGYAAGVGKTYAMLEAAQRERAQGVDIVVGYVEPHGRNETEALLAGLEAIPSKSVPYRGVLLREFDLDAALARRPQIILVDELAHTNVDGSRHAKRWQDIEELLDAGIDVWTTLNVQHVESLNDVIAQITGVVVRETLPDAVLEKADSIELIDLTPEELLERLQEGKVYIEQQAQRALQNFFQRQNLTALRELSLRQTADRLRRDVDAAREALRRTQPWATNERLLVCVGPSPTTTRLIRAAKRMAAAFGAEWIATAVEPSGRAASPDATARIAQHLRLAEQLGATTHILSGTRVAETVLEFSRARNVTKIIIGKTAQPWWRRAVFGSVVDDLLKHSGPIDVYVIQGEAEHETTTRVARAGQPAGRKRYFAAASVVTVCAAASHLAGMLRLSETNQVMLFLLGVAWTAYRYGRGPGVFSAIASVLVFDLFFVPPLNTFAVSDVEYLVTFGVMLVIGLTISTLTVRLSEQLAVAKRQEFRTASLFQLTKQLSAVQGTDFLTQIAGRRLSEVFEGEAMICTLRDGELTLRYGEKTSINENPQNALVARWVAEHEQMAGMGTDTLPSATAFFVPLTGSQQTVGAVGVRSADESRMLDPEQRRLLTTCASLIALSVERDWSVVEAQESRLKAEAEKLRSTLLSSVSHDLRTPLAVIAGASTSLLEGDRSMGQETRRELLDTLVDESRRLSRLVENLLHMTRLESGVKQVNKEWHVFEDVVGSAVRESYRLDCRRLETDIPADLPLVPLDPVLIEQVLINLFDNAAKYSPPGKPVRLIAGVRDGNILVEISDQGPGLQPGEERRIFDRFFRSAAAEERHRGTGLGLAICRAIIEAHGGRIWARNRNGAPGAVFSFTLPLDHPPHLPSTSNQLPVLTDQQRPQAEQSSLQSQTPAETNTDGED